MAAHEDFDPWEVLLAVSSQEDGEIDLALVALALSALQHEGVSAGRYLHHLKRIGEDVVEVYNRYISLGEVDCADLRLRILSEVLADEYGYIGDSQSYDDLQNASLIRVIDRAKGIPISLSILYIHAARSMGWDVTGLDFPGHFICRIDMDGERLIFDPFYGGAVLEAPDLREMVKQALGAAAELSSDYYNPATNRATLIRLENNIKHRKIEAEDYAGALQHVERMRLVAPDDYRLLLDAGVLYAKTEQPKAAIESLSRYVDLAPAGRGRYEAELLLSELVQQLN